MADNELIWRIAGGSGDGIASTSQNFAKALMRAGLHVFTHRHYPSRIRGGHTYVEVRASADPVKSRGDGYNFLLALGDSFARNPQDEAYYGNEEIKPLSENLDELREGGVIIYDEGLVDTDDIPDFDERVEENDWHVYPLDLRGLAREQGREVMRNTAGVGATCAITGIKLEWIEELMRDAMPEKILEPNLEILETAYDSVQEEYDTDAPDIDLPEGEHDEDQLLMSGSDAIAYGAIDEGCRFIAGYPMTPWTEVFTIMSKNLPELGGISEQVEDEIAAAALAIGASHAGAKAMSGSSGGGFALMGEPLGLAEMTETPLVLIEAMRAGPSTGMPTKPEQADLEHVLYTSQGDSQRVVFAPGTVQEAYDHARKAFEVAYDYQIPTIVLYDQKLSGELTNVPESHFDRDPNPGMGKTLTEAELEDQPHTDDGQFHRFQHDVEDGVTPRSVPGQKGGRYLATGNEHNPAGHIAEAPDNRIAQMDRRSQKLAAIRENLDSDSLLSEHGPDEADYGILTFGSQQGTVEEAVDRLNDGGTSVKLLTVGELMPYPREQVAEFIESVDEVLVVEMNASAQFRGLTQKELGQYGEKLSSLLKYNGNPFEPREIVEGFETNIVAGEGDSPDHQTKFVPPAEDAGASAAGD
ncbi:2-oxoacid:acceptor oxidoreductase subunit alpha [Candidatus Halobonum tyrrellensis]|uniref:2-oxoglutarate synthase subunit KorA n=1 Tax=Candidatus Halobonum tyrrellensis G22 TaxID=1324957 RepID=V4HL66_9EURY|nr:2-oxoacid:acceptor oxidoreductase subunit alpha [Candidatus Halobonum tyrrellensis]ESP88669.1 pyruvate flavodoxin/ferredoxin oxidoreductase domain protein [Candidatus Halobonum tyrrellensis G22]